MTPEQERYEKLRILFDQVLELPSEERETAARRLCDGDRDLETDLLALLHSADKPTGPLDTPVARFDSGRVEAAFTPNEMLLNRFRIVRFLGRGGMGEVYQADDLEMGRVALKTVRPDIAEHPEILAKFRDEVQLARKATGTNVCRIHEIFALPRSAERSATVFLTMEFLEGVTLAERIETGGPLALEEAERIALQICRGLETIHEADVIHRDLKSRNIMLAQRKRGIEAVVMDFGLARVAPSRAAATVGSDASLPGAVAGTPQFMAPEQFQGAKATPATDIYALGVVLYELVTGKLPFAGPTPLAAAVERGKPLAKVSKMRPGLPPQWDLVIERCLRYKPEERFQSAAEVAQALTARPQAVSPRRMAVAAALLLAVLGASGLVWYLMHSGRGSAGGSPAAQRWYVQGTAALREGTYLKATTALQQAVDLDKSFVLAHVRLADAWNELDFSGKAKDEMLQASELESSGGLSSLDKQYVEAVRHTIVRDFTAAIQDYRKILDSLPGEDKADGYVDLGRAYEKANKVDEAIANYSAAAKLDGQSPAAFVHLGVLQSRLKHNAEGAAAFETAERLYRAGSNLEGIAEVEFQRGANANTQSRLDEARTELGKSLEAAKAIPSLQLQIRALTRLSVTEYLGGNTDKSIQLANQAIRMAEENRLDYWAGDARIRLGNAYIIQGDYGQSAANFEQALKLAQQGQWPRLIALAQQSLASAREMQNRPAEAAPLARAAFEFYKSAGFRIESVESLTLLVRALADSENLQAALLAGQDLLALAKSLNEKSAIMPAEETVAEVYMSMESYPAALDHFQKALAASRQINREVGDQALNCADVLWRLGNYDQAEQLLDSLPAANRNRRVELSANELRAAMALSEQRYAEAKALALRVLADPADSEPEVCYRLLARVEAAAGSPARAQEWARKALAKAKQDSDGFGAAAANLALANALVAGGSVGEALPLAQGAHAFFAGSGRKESECLSILTLARACRRLHKTADSKTFALEGLDIFSQLQHNWGPREYEGYFRRPDVREARAELERLGRQ